MSDIQKLEQTFWERLGPDGELERTSFRPESDEWTEMVGIVWRRGEEVVQAVQIEVPAEHYAIEGVRTIVHDQLLEQLGS